MADAGASRRVVVTGMGVVTPIGQTVADFWAGLRQGQSGVGPIESFPQNDPHILHISQIKDFELQVRIAAQIKGFDKQARLKHFKRDKIILHADRYSLFAAAAADEAVKQSGLEVPFKAPYRAASIIGSAFGAGHESRGRLSPHLRAQASRLPSPDPRAFHRLLRGRAYRHRARHQGTDVRHLQRLLLGRARHGAWSRLHPQWARRRRRRRGLGRTRNLRHDAGLAGNAAAVAAGHLPVRQKAQWHRAGRGRGHSRPGIDAACQGARRKGAGGAVRLRHDDGQHRHARSRHRRPRARPCGWPSRTRNLPPAISTT